MKLWGEKRALFNIIYVDYLNFKLRNLKTQLNNKMIYIMKLILRKTNVLLKIGVTTTIKLILRYGANLQDMDT